MTFDMWHVTCDIWHVTHDTWHMTWTHDIWIVTHGGRLTFSQNFRPLALALACRTAPATPGLLRIWSLDTLKWTQDFYKFGQFTTSGPMDPPLESCESPYGTLLYWKVCESKFPPYLAWDKLHDRSGSAAHLRSGRISASPWLAGPWPCKVIFYWVWPVPWWYGLMPISLSSEEWTFTQFWRGAGGQWGHYWNIPFFLPNITQHR